MNVGVRELRDGLSRHLAAVRGGTAITVTDHGKPVARLIPYETDSGLERWLRPEVVRIAEQRAKDIGISVERVIAEAVELGLHDAPSPVGIGFPVMAGMPGHVVTDELVDAYRDDV